MRFFLKKMGKRFFAFFLQKKRRLHAVERAELLRLGAAELADAMLSAQDEGYEGFVCGKCLADNPYEAGGLLAMAWAHGWNDARVYHDPWLVAP